MEAEKAKDPTEGLEAVLYPSEQDRESGSRGEPSQKMGDYALVMSHHETGRAYSAIKDLGVEGGVGPGAEVRREAIGPRVRWSLCKHAATEAWGVVGLQG